ncbi:IRK-interacting protein-like [Primulina huaijiensis]|uniref:IRK-interacting protein-like n=1 Tax=Primulina huaijiensis TaxID=1492673 RepID=UPI003CC6E13C
MADIYQVRSSIGDSGNGNRDEVKREDIEAAIAKSVELRALHAALMQGNSPVKLRFDLASPVSCNASQFSAQDYPVFTPSYEDESLPGYQHVLENRNYAEIWGEYPSDREIADETVSTEYRLQNPFSRKGLPSGFVSFDSHISPPDDQNSAVCSCANSITVLGASPEPDSCKSRKSSLGDLTLIPASTCNKCKPAIISIESDGGTKNSKKSNMIVPYADSNSSLNSQPSNKGMNFSCLFPRIKKKSKDEGPPIRPRTEEVSQTSKDSEIVSIETLKKELIKANESRDAALVEVAEMKSVLGELSHKLEYLETYCEELKKALQVKNPQTHPTKDGKSVYGNGENIMPVSEEELVEGFLQLVSESRRTVKQFCKILVGQIQETDHTSVNNLNLVLQPYNLSLNSKYIKPVLYHLEAVINQSLFQDFENSMFQRNGTPKILDPKQDRHEKLNSFVALRNLSWNDVLHKGINCFSDEFSKFCDNKMGGILATLRWTKPWSEQLLQAFFAAAKSIWLLHLLAFSSDPPFCIMRVYENRPFEARYMEDIFAERQRLQNTGRVKIMVLPGFYVQDRVVRCKVLCKYKHVT